MKSHCRPSRIGDASQHEALLERLRAGESNRRSRPTPATGTFLAQWPLDFVSGRSQVSPSNAEFDGSSLCRITTSDFGELQPNGRTSNRRRFAIDPLQTVGSASGADSPCSQQQQEANTGLATSEVAVFPLDNPNRRHLDSLSDFRFWCDATCSCRAFKRGKRFQRKFFTRNKSLWQPKYRQVRQAASSHRSPLLAWPSARAHRCQYIS